MRIITKEKRSDMFGDDIVYRVDSLSNIDDIKMLLSMLSSDGYTFDSFSIHYVYDHADFKPSINITSFEELSAALLNCDFNDLENINIMMKNNGYDVYGFMYPNSNVFRLSFPKKKSNRNKR